MWLNYLRSKTKKKEEGVPWIHSKNEIFLGCKLLKFECRLYHHHDNFLSSLNKYLQATKKFTLVSSTLSLIYWITWKFKWFNFYYAIEIFAQIKNYWRLSYIRRALKFAHVNIACETDKWLLNGIFIGLLRDLRW